MKPIALITHTDIPELSESDDLLITPLKKEGFEPHIVHWDKEGVKWDQYDYVILRSCWNYHKKFNEFIKWLDLLERKGVVMINPIELIKWNIKKTYLQDLEKMGVPIIPTVWIQKKSQYNLTDAFKKYNGDELVVKPTIGQSAYGIFKVKREERETNQKRLNRLLQLSDVMIQPFMKEVKEGEISFMFIGGEFTHAVIKKPRKNEFRTNYHFGGIEEKIIPDTLILQQAKNIVQSINSQVLYARVDCLVSGRKLIVMELELIDPHLFLDLEPHAATTFAKFLRKITV